MQKKKITNYELLGLMICDKAPMVVYYGGIEYCRANNNYRHELLTDEDDEDWYLFTSFDKYFLNDTVEIQLEEDSEWEDIEELDSWKFNTSEDDIPHFELSNKINQLIKNQKYLKERLDKNES